MKILNRINKLLAVGILVFVSSQAYATAYSLSDYAWAYDSSGEGNISSDEVISNDSFSFEGYTLVTVDTTTATSGLNGATFTDYTYLTNTQTGVYSVATLTGAVNVSTGSTTAVFDDASDAMTWYSSTGQQILTLDLVTSDTGVDGHSLLSVDTTAETLTVGQITLYLSISTVQSGYFYIYLEDQGIWVDFADLIANGDTLLLSSATTSTSAEDGDISDEILSILTGLGGVENYAGVADETDLIDLTAADLNNGTYSYALAHDGGIDIDSSAVPEPGMLSLMGLAFIGLAGFQRRRNKKQMEL